MNIAIIKSKISPILKRHGVKRAAIFGSYARGEQKKRSDIDILIKYKNDDKSYFDLVGLQIELEEILGKKVDLADYGMIRPRMRSRILKDRVSIL